MIDQLALLLEAFPGSENRTRCFNHILNLVAKCILRQFDLPKGDDGGGLDDAAKALAALASEIDESDLGDGAGDGEADNEEGMINARAGMTEEEIAELEASMQPVRMVLAKVCCEFGGIHLLHNQINPATQDRFLDQELDNDYFT